MSNIRPLHADDFEQWLTLWNGYLEFYAYNMPEDMKALTFKRLIAHESGMNASVYETKGQIKGIVHFIYHASTWTEGPYCYLQDLFVTPENRGEGIATALIEHVYATATQQRCSRVYWLTHETNATAIKLYDKVAARSGFIQYRKVL